MQSCGGRGGAGEITTIRRGRRSALYHLDAHCAKAPPTCGGDIEGNRVAIVQQGHPRSAHLAVAHIDVIASVAARDEAETLFAVVEFYMPSDSRSITIGKDEDDQEAMCERGWSDGLPLVPPAEERVLRMLDGTSRDPQEVIGLIPPALQPATVEKIAVNAVMAGCKPEYLPVVLAAVEAVLEEGFAMHGVLATTMFVGPVVVVNGPIRHRIGMNAKGNVLGQGNRANAAIGRALQLVIRNIGGGRPQEVDHATLAIPANTPTASPRTRKARALGAALG